MKYCISLLFAIIAFSQETIKMNAEPESANLITFKELITLDGGDDGYYNSISVRIFKNKYIVYDKGNFIIHIYDNNGNEEFSFGKAGNGPGEFTQYENLMLVGDNRILTTQWDKVSIYDFQGVHIKDIKIEAYSYHTRIENDHLIFDPKIGKNKPAYEYDLNGNKIKETPKDESQEEEKEFFVLDDIKAMAKTWLKPSDWKKYDDYTLRFSKLEYRIDIGNTSGEILKSLTRPFDRVKLEMDEDWKYVTTGNKKKDKELNAKYRVEYERTKKGFETDIVNIIGFFQNYLLVQVSHSDIKNAYFDVLSIDGKFLSQLKIPIPHDTKKVKYFRLNGDKLVGHFRTDEIGPFAKVFQLSIN